MLALYSVNINGFYCINFCLLFNYRYYAIVRPFQTPIINRKSIKSLIYLWFMGFMFSLPQLIMTDIVPFNYGNESYLDCREEWDGYEFAAHMYTLFLFISTFLLPIIMLSILYSLIGCKIMSRIPISDSSSLSNEAQNNTIEDQRQKATIKVRKLIIKSINFIISSSQVN